MTVQLNRPNAIKGDQMLRHSNNTVKENSVLRHIGNNTIKGGPMLRHKSSNTVTKLTGDPI